MIIFQRCSGCLHGQGVVRRGERTWGVGENVPMRFDCVDIGTSDFDIGRGGYFPDKSYLLVEPIQYYLDKLDELRKRVRVIMFVAQCMMTRNKAYPSTTARMAASC